MTFKLRRRFYLWLAIAKFIPHLPLGPVLVLAALYWAMTLRVAVTCRHVAELVVWLIATLLVSALVFVNRKFWWYLQVAVRSFLGEL